MFLQTILCLVKEQLCMSIAQSTSLQTNLHWTNIEPSKYALPT